MGKKRQKGAERQRGRTGWNGRIAEKKEAKKQDGVEWEKDGSGRGPKAEKPDKAEGGRNGPKAAEKPRCTKTEKTKGQRGRKGGKVSRSGKAEKQKLQ